MPAAFKTDSGFGETTRAAAMVAGRLNEFKSECETVDMRMRHTCQKGRVSQCVAVRRWVLL